MVASVYLLLINLLWHYAASHIYPVVKLCKTMCFRLFSFQYERLPFPSIFSISVIILVVTYTQHVGACCSVKLFTDQVGYLLVKAFVAASTDPACCILFQVWSKLLLASSTTSSSWWWTASSPPDFLEFVLNGMIDQTTRSKIHMDKNG